MNKVAIFLNVLDPSFAISYSRTKFKNLYKVHKFYNIDFPNLTIYELNLKTKYYNYFYVTDKKLSNNEDGYEYIRKTYYNNVGLRTIKKMKDKKYELVFFVTNKEIGTNNDIFVYYWETYKINTKYMYLKNKNENLEEYIFKNTDVSKVLKEKYEKRGIDLESYIKFIRKLNLIQ